jgi:hypothetical protein
MASYRGGSERSRARRPLSSCSQRSPGTSVIWRRLSRVTPTWCHQCAPTACRIRWPSRHGHLGRKELPAGTTQGCSNMSCEDSASTFRQVWRLPATRRAGRQPTLPPVRDLPHVTLVRGDGGSNHTVLISEQIMRCQDRDYPTSQGAECP